MRVCPTCGAEWPETFSERLKKLRKDRGWTQDELARLVSTNNTAISAMELGNRDPRLSEIIKLAAALDCTPMDLLPGKAHWENGGSDDAS